MLALHIDYVDGKTVPTGLSLIGHKALFELDLFKCKGVPLLRAEQG